VALIAVCSAKGSPGATVTALAFTLSWTRRTILAECDPAGGDIAAGYLREIPLGERGLAQLTASLHRRRLAEDLWTQLVDLAPGKNAMSRLVLPGITDPGQALGLTTGWEPLAQHFRSLESGTQGYDVIADCGRLGTVHPPTPLLAAADAVLLVLRPTLPSIRAAAGALAGLRRDGMGPIGLVMVGEGEYGHRETAAQLRAPVVAGLPDDPGTAKVLCTGGEVHRGRLLRAAARAEHDVWEMINRGRASRATPTAATEVRSVR
jgi:MinD-like ATPase involved in chromosome partitioning or flagellar assembly